jgi:anti-sigma B factor antagonist
VAKGVPDLQMTVTKEGTETVLALLGDLDVYTSASLQECIVDLVHGVRPRIVVDLAGVDFVDSTGLGTLVGALQRVRRAGGDLTVRSPTAAIRRVIENSGLDQILPVRS